MEIVVFFDKLVFVHYPHLKLSTGTPTLGARGAAVGAGGARISLCAALFLSLMPCEGAFSGIVDSFVSTNFSGGKPPDPQVNVV